MHSSFGSILDGQLQDMGGLLGNALGLAPQEMNLTATHLHSSCLFNKLEVFLLFLLWAWDCYQDQPCDSQYHLWEPRSQKNYQTLSSYITHPCF